MAFVAGVFLLVLMVNIVADVVLRATTGKPLAGTLELVSQWWMPLLVFFGLGYAQYRDEHIRVTVVSERLGAGLAKVAESLTLLIAVAIVLVLTWAGWNEAVRSFELREAMTGTLGLPVWPMKFVMVAGFLGLVVELLLSLQSVFRPAEDAVLEPQEEVAAS